MKQTISILTGLIMVVLLATGFIVADNIGLNRRMVERENELVAMHEKLDASQMQVKKTTGERDALNRQLNEAVLASQTAHEEAQAQRRLTEQAHLELEALQTEYRDLTKVCAALEAQLRQPEVPEEKPQRPAARRQPERFVEY